MHTVDRNMILSCFYLSADVGNKVLDICHRNVSRNLLDLELPGEIRVKELDWMKPFDSNGTYTCMHAHIYTFIHVGSYVLI